MQNPISTQTARGTVGPAAGQVQLGQEEKSKGGVSLV